MSAHSSIGPARRRTFTPYVWLYLLAAIIATAYLVFIGARPDLVAMWRAKPNDTQAALVETQRTVERALADIDPLKQGLGEMKMDVANVKVGMQEAAERDRILLEKVETLERAAVQASEKVAAAAPAQPAAKKQVVAKAPEATANAAAATAAKPATPTAIETGSIEHKKAAAPPKPTPVGVLLATGPSLDSLRLSWTILNDRHAATVKSLQPRYVVSGKADERTYGLVAGPLETIADAKAVCKTMTDNGIPCEVSQFRGNAF
ncbi:MAG: hypothetical protein K8F92_15755 [Hyphomicrobium sp.]|uniref:hypothetical protein n=1 Tax=Hyphomicrobium sp. TaxID=82 RepID=UPI0013297E37|nr:hypothetical protein [Hyphomicrobium sp.]KAB2940270.1 MAG: hypothetical protein F9K20_13545 [Hyphomicrobium sp.]MBZ0211086.1 hypothetical protein [Hyphomicrobium sp.]